MNTGKILAILFILNLSFVFTPISSAESISEREKTYMAVKSILGRQDSFLAIEYLNGMENPLVTAEKYNGLVKDFYWKDKSILKVVFFSRAGIQFCLSKAAVFEKTDKEKRDSFLNHAKSMAYNLASFTWPGWAEKGIKISPSNYKVGLDAAKLNLRLTKKLKMPRKNLSYAYWVLGAQNLANGNPNVGVENFIKAKEAAVQGEMPFFATYVEGCIGIGKIIDDKDSSEGKDKLENAISSLEAYAKSEALFFSKQLKTAEKVFLEK